jgi:hypothetical protein
LTVKDDQGRTDAASVVITVTPVDTIAPTIAAVATPRPDRLILTFNKPVQQADAEAVSNYAVDRDIKVNSASLGKDLQTVTLATSPLADGADYGITVKNVSDRARKPNVIAPEARKAFRYSGLFAWWKLDDGKDLVAVDASGNGLEGSLRGEPVWTNAGGRVSLSLDGVDDVVVTPTMLADLALPFSISLWVNPAATQVEYADILGNHDGAFGLVMQQDGKKSNIFGFGYGDGKQGYGPGAVQLTAGEWQHVAVVCDGEKAVCYVNGAEKCSNAAKGTFAHNPNLDFKLGQGYKEGRFFHGLLSDVRIYRKALSAAAVQALAKEGGVKSGNTKGKAAN